MDAEKIGAEIERIVGLDIQQARVLWGTTFKREAPKGLPRLLLLRMVAWRLQEKAFGGHDRETLKLLAGYASGKGKAARTPRFKKLKSGTVLIREYQGVRHTVTITQDGYIWRERAYSNLSVIARTITGSNWNGPRFFGLRAKPGSSPDQALTSP